ncbi:hypothetical protein CAEBREN_07232 [Caenorhabditis brenneri]|uniref:F-box domain-containing protein n=1 Tax=Caenorhabditis brenneri TaxID=135651 RepID=G0NMJ4_CAEBE|nr:hypothetical protein CAEBREN_07232 [Caenorhabditis brenneri]
MPEWSTLIDDVKTHIVEFLDYTDRCNMRLCSKSDKILVDKTRFRAGAFAISERISEMSSEKTLIRIDIDTFTIWFIGKDNVSRIDRGWNEEVLEEYSKVKKENRYDLIRNFLEKYQRKFGVIEAKSILLVMFEQQPPTNLKIKCDNLTIYECGDHHQTWLNQCASQKFKKLDICRSNGNLLPIDDRILRTSESLKLSLNCDMTDEQLVMLKCADLQIKSDMITANGIKRYLEIFLTLGQKQDVMELTIALSKDFPFMKLIPDTLQFHKTKIPSWSSSVFRAMITGGFKNVHGIHDPRCFRVRFTPEKAEIECRIEEKTVVPCDLDPIVLN